MILRPDPLLIHYTVRIREVTIGVILLLTFMFYFFPRFLGEGERTPISTSLTSLFRLILIALF